jgi:hypothetical protein
MFRNHFIHAQYLCAPIVGDDERARRMRRTIVRYCLLAYVLVLRKVCSPVNKRFPSMQHVVQAGTSLP